MWWRQLGDVQYDHQNGAERGSKWLCSLTFCPHDYCNSIFVKINKYILTFLGRGLWKYNKVIWRPLHQWSEAGAFLSVQHRAGSWRDLALNEWHWQLLRESEVASALNCVRCDLKSLQSDRFKKKKKSCYLFLDQSYSLRLITRSTKYVNKSVILIPFSVTEVWISGDRYPFVFFLL